MNKISRIVVSIFICILFVISIFQYSYAASDMDKPHVSSIILDKHQVKPGDTLKITMNIDDASDISTEPESDNKTFLYLKNGSSYTDLFYFTKQSNGVYTSVVTIPATYVNGYYFLSYLVVTDVEGNEYNTYSYSDFPTVYFEVTGASSDESAPVVKAIEIDKHSAVPGDQVTITLEISDENELDLDMFNSYLYLKNDGYESAPFVFERIASRRYKATRTIDNTYLNGRYQFSELSLTDLAGNNYLNTDPSSFSEIYIDITGASDDRSEPEVGSMTIDNHDVKLGDSVTITSELIDDSNIEDNSIRHYLILKNGTFYSEMFLFEQLEGNTYAATIPITEDYYDGTYVPDYYIVSDIIGNKKIIYGSSEYPEIYFTVSGHSAVEYYHKPGWFLSDGIWYFNDEHGNRVIGWLKRGSTWYYLNSAGEMQTGWIKSNGKWYYMDLTSGAMYTNSWVYDQGDWYHVDASGAMQTGWYKNSDNKWFYLNASGAMQTGWIKSNGKWYYMDLTSGAMYTNSWVYDQGDWYHVDASGAMQTGWYKNSNNKWFYLNTSGAMQTEWKLLGDSCYYFNPENGEMKIGWLYLDDQWYYFNNLGVMQVGWLKLNNQWYFLKSSGAMAANEWCNGYWIGKDGVWTYQPIGSWRQNDIGWWFGDTSGWYAINETVRINYNDYEFDENGYWIDPSKPLLLEETEQGEESENTSN